MNFELDNNDDLSQSNTLDALWDDDDELSESTLVLGDDALELTSMQAFESTFARKADATAVISGGDESFAVVKERPRYNLSLMVGEGAMGQIFVARDADLLRKVAYKKLHEKVTADRQVLSRFIKEVQITAQLEHPNVVPVYSLEKTADNSMAYAMKLVLGRDLKEILQETRDFYDKGQVPDESHSQEELLSHFLKVCDALDYAHHKGVIHRDLKPANIMVGRYNEVYVMDWGIARVIGALEESEDENIVRVQFEDDAGEDALDKTQAGQILGTPRYLSPEQAAGKNAQLDGRSDLLTLGLILFEIITLKPAYTAKNMTELLKRVLKTEKEPYLHYAPKVAIPEELKAICDKATARKRDQRYQTVREMAEDIRRYLRGEAVLAKKDTPIQALLRWTSRHQTLTAVVIFIILFGSALSASFSIYQQQQVLIKTQIREQKTNALITAVANQTQRINNRFLSFEVLVQGLAAATQERLILPPSPGRFYLNEDFATRNKTPPDYQYSPHYGKLISLEWPVFKRAPGLAFAEAEASILKLHPLRHYFKALLLKSAEQNPAQSPKTVQRLLAQTGVPVIWSYVGLENGLHMAYPGKTAYPVAYDPRQRPWYKQTKDTQGVQWNSPYVDVQGQGLVLPCTTAIYSNQGQFLGVAGVELTFSYLVDHLMTLQQIPHVIQSYLLDNKGRIMVKSSDRKRKYGMRFGIDTLNEALDLPLFNHPELVEAIQAHRSGYLEYRENGRNIILAHYYLSAIDWFYVVAVDKDRFMQDYTPTQMPMVPQ